MDPRVRLRKTLAVASGLTFMVLRFLLPRRHHTVVAGMTPDEGNAAEMVRALASRYDGTIWWIAPPSPAVMETLGLTHNARVVRVEDRWRLRVIVAYLTAELVITTHGLYGMPATPRRKPVLDVWHGGPAKGGGRHYPFRRLPGRPSSFLVVTSGLLAEHTLSGSGMTRRQMIWAANPRVDQLGRPASDAMLVKIGLDPSRPFVVWMPTFRQGKGSVRDAAWVNTSDADLDSRLSDLLGSMLSDQLDQAGVQLVVKPHPLDLLAREVRGGIVLLSEDLNEVGLPLYSLLGRSAGLITDYSSVWMDYLTVDRPIAFYMPDRQAFEVGRGSLPDGAYDSLPGFLLESDDDVRAFVGDVLNSGEGTAGRRKAAVERLALKLGPGAADAILDVVRPRTLGDG